MVIYGVALLSGCLLLGSLGGELLGVILGVQANVGGVGLAMLLLVLACSSPKFKTLVEGASGNGIRFWSAMYIPIVVAMAARQNVVAAVAASFALVPILSRIGSKGDADSRNHPASSTDGSIDETGIT